MCGSTSARVRDQRTTFRNHVEKYMKRDGFAVDMSHVDGPIQLFPLFISPSQSSYCVVNHFIFSIFLYKWSIEQSLWPGASVDERCSTSEESAVGSSAHFEWASSIPYEGDTKWVDNSQSTDEPYFTDGAQQGWLIKRKTKYMSHKLSRKRLPFFEQEAPLKVIYLPTNCYWNLS